MKVSYKIWFDNNGKAFGEGPYHLLRGIEKTGSLHQAALEMGMSYRKAWLTLQACEERLGLTLIERKVGGRSGGGSELTAAARVFIGRYEKFREEDRTLLDQAYDRHFG